MALGRSGHGLFSYRGDSFGITLKNIDLPEQISETAVEPEVLVARDPSGFAVQPLPSGHNTLRSPEDIECQ